MSIAVLYTPSYLLKQERCSKDTSQLPGTKPTIWFSSLFVDNYMYMFNLGLITTLGFMQEALIAQKVELCFS
jgi:hypothetical protein